MMNVAPSIFDVVSTSEVARALQVAENTIRSWESRGVLVPFTRLATGMRLYRREDVERVGWPVLSAGDRHPRPRSIAEQAWMWTAPRCLVAVAVLKSSGGQKMEQQTSQDLGRCCVCSALLIPGSEIKSGEPEIKTDLKSKRLGRPPVVCQTGRCLLIRRERRRMARQCEARAGWFTRRGDAERAAQFRRMAGWWRGPLDTPRPRTAPGWPAMSRYPVHSEVERMVIAGLFELLEEVTRWAESGVPMSAARAVTIRESAGHCRRVLLPETPTPATPGSVH